MWPLHVFFEIGEARRLGRFFERWACWPTEMVSDSEVLIFLYFCSVQEKHYEVDISSQRQGVLLTTCGFSQQKRTLGFKKTELRQRKTEGHRWFFAMVQRPKQGVDAEVYSEKHQRSLSRCVYEIDRPSADLPSISRVLSLSKHFRQL